MKLGTHILTGAGSREDIAGDVDACANWVMNRPSCWLIYAGLVKTKYTKY